MGKLRVWLLSVLGAIVALELGLLLFWAPPDELRVWDDELGYRLRPGATGSAPAPYRINAAGRRERDVPEAKPKDTLRIAVLGDEYALALDLAERHTFCRVMEQRLGSEISWNGREIEVLNFAVDGYGPTQHLLVLRRHVWKYDPDVVLLAFVLGSDIQRCSPELWSHEPTPFLVPRDAELVLDNSFRDQRPPPPGPWVAFLTEYSGIGALVKDLVRRFRARTKTPRWPTGWRPELYGEPPGAWQEAWRVAEKTLSLIRDEVRAKDGPVFRVVLPTTDFLVDKFEGMEDWYKDEMVKRHFAAEDLEYPTRRLLKYCKDDGIKVLDLVPVLRAYARTNNVALHGTSDRSFGPWNLEGHRIAGEATGDWLVEQLR